MHRQADKKGPELANRAGAVNCLSDLYAFPIELPPPPLLPATMIELESDKERRNRRSSHATIEAEPLSLSFFLPSFFHLDLGASDNAWLRTKCNARRTK